MPGERAHFQFVGTDPALDEVLARLLALNADRAAAEARADTAAGPPGPGGSRPHEAGDILRNSF